MRVSLIAVAITSMAISSILTAGCATQKQLVSTGGSRANGTVDLSFEYGMFEKPHWDWNQAHDEAAQRCAAWGYSGAERFGGTMKSVRHSTGTAIVCGRCSPSRTNP